MKNPESSPDTGTELSGFVSPITEGVRKYAAEQGIAEEAALAQGIEENSKEFVEKGAEVYAKA
jgi:phosphomethylpyrimidine synthase